jgi:HlyD family secretion protein
MNRSFAAGLFAVSLAVGCDRPEGFDASGTIEFTQTDVAGTLPARVERILVDEGATVAAGDTLAILRQTGLPQDIQQRRARLAAAESELRDLQRGARPAEIDRARSELRSATSEADRTAADSLRMTRLLAAGGISQSEFDAAANAARVAGARRDAASDALRLLEAGTRPDRVAAARSSVAAARAQLAMGEAAADELVLTAPVAGQVMARLVEPGEVIGAGIPVLSLGDNRNVWVRVYVNAAVFASIKVGDTVPVTIDGLEGESFPARVTALATAAEFTPRVALTEKERADLLFGVKLELTDTTGRLKAGLPATAHFSAEGRGPTADGRTGDSTSDR